MVQIKQMKSNILQFKGLYGDQSSNAFPGLLLWEPLEVRSKLYNWEIEEHIHDDLLQFFWIESGKGIIKSGKDRYPFEGPCILSIPSNHSHGFSFQPAIEGDVLSVSTDYVGKILESEPQITQMVLDEILLIQFIDFTDSFLAMKAFKKSILQEWKEENEQKSLAMKAYFLLFFTQLYRLQILQKGHTVNEDKKSLRYVQQFKKLVRQNLLEHWSIPQYAIQLGISRIHLNRICQETLGETAHQLIQNQLIIEAKNYLLNSSYSISEIAYLLNYKDPAYFSRVFRKATGVSPSEFQKN